MATKDCFEVRNVAYKTADRSKVKAIAIDPKSLLKT